MLLVPVAVVELAWQEVTMREAMECSHLLQDQQFIMLEEEPALFLTIV